MADFEKARREVASRIAQALDAAGRPAGSCALLAVSKTFPAQALREAYAAGQRDFGENYVQELLDKAQALQNLEDLQWHFIGPLQSNKTATVAQIAAWVHSVDRLKIAERLSAQRPAHLPELNLCIQVNVSGEASKSGCEPAQVAGLAQAIASLPRLRLRGLMAIPEPSQDPAVLAERFGLLRQLQAQLLEQGLVLDTLSMGMSADLEQAIGQGSTMVRVGTALFGQR